MVAATSLSDTVAIVSLHMALGVLILIMLCGIRGPHDGDCTHWPGSLHSSRSKALDGERVWLSGDPAAAGPLPNTEHPALFLESTLTSPFYARRYTSQLLQKLR